ESGHWTAFVPAAARWPVEVHLYPRRRAGSLPELTAAERDDFAPFYLDLLGRLDRLFDAPLPYVAAWHQEPVHAEPGLAYLHLEVFSVRRAPGKLKYLAGSESGMGVFVNDVLPETTAQRLREAAQWNSWSPAAPATSAAWSPRCWPRPGTPSPCSTTCPPGTATRCRRARRSPRRACSTPPRCSTPPMTRCCTSRRSRWSASRCRTRPRTGGTTSPGRWRCWRRCADTGCGAWCSPPPPRSTATRRPSRSPRTTRRCPPAPTARASSRSTTCWAAGRGPTGW